MRVLKIPETSVSRLSIYSRFLAQLQKKDIETISSVEIADYVGINPAQVRKDLAYFGEFGVRGVGYNVKSLHSQVLKILGLNNSWQVIVVGGGSLGTALCKYKGFFERGFTIAGVFDIDSSKFGQNIDGVQIYDMQGLGDFVKKNNIKMGIIAVPDSEAQNVADVLVENNIKAILNFAPVNIELPDDVYLRKVDLTLNLEILTYNLANNLNASQ